MLPGGRQNSIRIKENTLSFQMWLFLIGNRCTGTGKDQTSLTLTKFYQGLSYFSPIESRRKSQVKWSEAATFHQWLGSPPWHMLLPPEQLNFAEGKPLCSGVKMGHHVSGLVHSHNDVLKALQQKHPVLHGWESFPPIWPLDVQRWCCCKIWQNCWPIPCLLKSS